MSSSLRLTLALLPDPLRDLPQPLNREQRWVNGEDIGVGWPAVISQARCDGPVIAIGHANDEIGIWSSAYTNEVDALTVQRMVRVGHRRTFLRWLGKGGSVL